MSEETEPVEEQPQKPKSGAGWIEFAAVLAVVGILIWLLIPAASRGTGQLLLAGGLLFPAASIAAGIGFSKKWTWKVIDHDRRS